MSAEYTHDRYGIRVYSGGFPEGFGYIRGYGHVWFPGFFGEDREFRHFRDRNGLEEETYSRGECLQYVLDYVNGRQPTRVKPRETPSLERERVEEETQKNIETVADLTAFLSIPQNREGTWWGEDEGIVRFFHEEPDEDGDRVIFSLSESEFVEDFFSQFGFQRDHVYQKEGK